MLQFQAGGLDITVDAQGLSRAFQTFGTETISFGQINVTGGNADIGGAIYASGFGNVIVFGGEYSGNVATGEGGGAIFSAAGNLSIGGGAIFDGNVASGASGSGGAIFNNGGTAVANSATFTANIANRAGGAIEIGTGELFLTNILADGNVAGPAGFAAPGNGGAVHMTGGDLVVVTDSEFFNNVAALEGGGIWNQAGTALFVNGTTFENNVAAGDGADDGGGAIFNNGGDLVVNGSFFNDNAANGTAGSGGAIFSVDGRVLVQDDSEFSNNRSARAGGAIEIIDGEFFDTRSDYSANDTGVSLTASPGNGGAVHITGSGTSAFNRTQFNDNSAGSEGGAVWNSADSTMFLSDVEFFDNVASGNDADNGGGAIFNNGGEVVVGAGRFFGNVADGDAGSGGAIFSTDGRVLVQGGGVFFENLSARAGGAVEIIDGEFYDTDSTYVVNNTGVSLTASPGNGGAIHITGTAISAFTGSVFEENVAGSEGGGVWNAAGSTMYFNNVFFIDNDALGDDATNGGGGVFNNGGEVFINATNFEGNLASGTAGSGGAIFSTAGRVLVGNISNFTGNLSARAGGAVEIIDGEFFDSGSVYTENETGVTLAASPGNGGAFHITGTGTSAFTGSEFRGNLANRDGGAVWNAAGSTTFLTNVSITGNIARGSDADNGGGGIFNNGGSVFVNNSIVSNNQANGVSGSGGGALSVDGVLRFDNSTINGNLAARAGGGVEVIDGRAVFRTVALDSNTTGVNLPATPGNGGGLHVSGNSTVVTFSNSTITSNSAANQGGGLWNQIGSSIFLDNQTEVFDNFAQMLGGGIYNRGFLSALDTAFTINTSNDDGGAIYITASGRVQLENSSLTGNEADDDGGGVFNLGSLNSIDSFYASNVAGGTGGAIFTAPEARTSIDIDSAFSNFGESPNRPNNQN